MTDEQFTVFDIETTGKVPWRGKLLRAGIGATSYRMPQARREMRALLRRPGIIVEQTGFDARWALLDGAKLGPRAEIHDLRTMSWLLDENEPHDLGAMMERFLGEKITKPIVQRANVAVWSTAVWPLDGDDRAYVPLDEVPNDVMDEYNGADLDDEGRLYVELRRRLRDKDLWNLFLRREVPLARVLATLEAAGLPYDTARAELLRVKVQAEADELEAAVVAAAGVPVNLASVPQLVKLLFTPAGERVELKDTLRIDDADLPLLKDVPKDERVAWFNAGGNLPAGFEVQSVGRLYVKGVWVGEGMGLKVAEHGFGSSTGWKQKHAQHKNPATGSISLVLMNPDNEWVHDLVYWRELDKLAGAFLAKFPLYVRDGRLHGTVNRCGTVTGRFSSSEPNLQNIPTHGEYGMLVRALFCGELALGDYAQLEQRVATHYSHDPAMMKAYTDSVDLYGLAASTLFGGPATKDHERRGLMKTGMLALQYGAGAEKLAQLIMIDGHGTATVDDAKGLVAQLHEVFPVFFDWQDDVVEDAIRNGYVETIGGRRRHLAFPDGWLDLFRDRRAGRHGDKAAARRAWRARRRYSEEAYANAGMLERQCVNALCQGGAADIVAGAMVAVAEAMPHEAQVLVQVHDELVWQRLAGWNPGSLAKLRELCETGHGYALDVGLVFDAIEAESWAEKGHSLTDVNNLFSERMKRGRHSTKVNNASEGLQSRKASGLGNRRTK